MEVTSPGNTLVVSPHPILAQAGRQIYQAAFLPGETIAEYLDRMDVRLGLQPWLLMVDGHPVPREWWNRVRPKPGTIITLRALVHGGGGGGGKNPLKTVLSIALMVVAPQVGAWMATNIYGQSMLAFGTFTWAEVWTFAVKGIGTLMISGFGDQPSQALSQAGGRYNEEAVSPTYALTGGSNQARRFEPLPLLFGRHRMFPDQAAKSWTEFEGDDQFLYQIFNFGLSDMTLEDFKIGDTPIENYQDVEIVQAGADGRVANWPSNVDTIPGASLTQAAGWITRRSSLASTALAVDIQGVLYATGENGLVNKTCVLELEYQAVGATEWLPFRPDGLQYYTHYWSQGYPSTDGEGRAVWVQLDYGSTVAGDHVEGAAAGVLRGYATVWHWRAYTDIAALSGDPPAIDWAKPLREPAPPRQYTVDSNTLSLTSRSRKPIRRTIKRVVAEGQYDIRVRRVTADSTSATAASEFSWSELRSYQTDTTDYSGQRRVGLKIKASGQLQGQVDQFNAVARSREDVWDSTASAWGVAQNSNPAWAYLRLARGKRIDGRLVYGVGLADSGIDIEGLKAWAVWCDLHGLTFNAVFDAPRSRGEMLNLIAACGRASPTWATGKLGVVWDAEDQPSVAVFSMSNIVAGSFRVMYATEQLADEIVLNFVNEDTWQQDQVRVTVPGYGEGYVPTNPAPVEMFGCTNKAMAGKLANLRAAAQRYHRRRVQWETDWEGLVAQRGDVVTLSHDLTQWGTSGRLVAATDTTLTLDRKVSYSAGSPYVGVRHPDGTWHIRAVQAFSGETDVLTLVAPLTFTEGELTYHPGTDPHGPVVDYLYVFDPQATPGKKFKIAGVPKVNKAGSRLQFIARDEVPEYYAAETGAYTWTPPGSLSQSLPQITGLDVTEEWTLAGNSYAVKLIITWDAIGAADHAVIRYGYEQEPLHMDGTTRSRRYEILVPDNGSVRIEVRLLDGAGRLDAINGIATITHTISGKDFAVSDIAGLVVQDANGLALCRWSPVADKDWLGTEIRFGPVGSAWEDASGVTKATRGTQVTTAIVPPGTWDFFAKAHDTAGNVSLNAARSAATIRNTNTVIFSRDETLWWETGTITHAVIHGPTRSLVPDSQLTAQAAGWATFDQFCPSPWMDAAYETPELDLGSDGQARLYGVLISKLGPGATGIADPDTQLVTRLTGGSYGDYQPWDVGFAAARYFKFKVVFDVADGLAAITGLTPTADASERTEVGTATVAVGGSTVTFPTQFFLPPVVTPGLSGTTAGSASASNVTATGFTGQRFTAAGADAGGAITYTAKGV